jgi:hypothetical protein
MGGNTQYYPLISFLAANEKEIILTSAHLLLSFRRVIDMQTNED